MQTTQIRIVGDVQGPIWMPAVECTKEVDRHFTLCDPDKNIRALNEIDCLRDALLVVTNDGDFQHCELLRGSMLCVTKIRRNGYAITRSWALRGAGDNADCFAG